MAQLAHFPTRPTPPPSPKGDASYEIPLDMSMCIFNYNKTVGAIILKYLLGHP